MVRHVAVMANATARAGRHAPLLHLVVDRLRAAGYVVRMVVGRNAGDAEKQAQDAVSEGADLLVAVGGDGLVNLALQAVAGTQVPLGVVPAGTGNDAARTLGLPAAPRLRHAMAAVDVVVAGVTRRVDAGRADGRWFLTVVSSGFDSQVNARANRMAWPHSPARFHLAMAAELPSFRPVPYTLVTDDQVLHLEAMIVAVGNGPCYGGGMRVCPGADLQDGLLDVTVVGALSPVEFIRLFPSVYRGTHLRHPAVTTFRACAVAVSAPGMTAHADGEPLGALPIQIHIEPEALTVFVPR